MFKYIMFDVNGTQIPIIFPKVLVHSEVAKANRKVVSRTNAGKYPAEVVSAGFVFIKPADNLIEIKLECYGESETLGLKSRPGDGEIITNHPWSFGHIGSLSIL